MPPVPRNADREKARLTRKKDIAKQQVQQFEDELSGQELNRARLVAAGQSTEDTDLAIETIQRAIEITEAEAGKIAPSA